MTWNRTRVAIVCLRRVVVIREGGEEEGEERMEEEKAER